MFPLKRSPSCLRFSFFLENLYCSTPCSWNWKRERGTFKSRQGDCSFSRAWLRLMLMKELRMFDYPFLFLSSSQRAPWSYVVYWFHENKQSPLWDKLNGVFLLAEDCTLVRWFLWIIPRNEIVPGRLFSKLYTKLWIYMSLWNLRGLWIISSSFRAHVQIVILVRGTARYKVLESPL